MLNSCNLFSLSLMFRQNFQNFLCFKIKTLVPYIFLFYKVKELRKELCVERWTSQNKEIIRSSNASETTDPFTHQLLLRWVISILELLKITSDVRLFYILKQKTPTALAKIILIFNLYSLSLPRGNRDQSS